MLRLQDPYGRWNKNAQTGFVTTAYALHALSRLYPLPPDQTNRTGFESQPNESLRTTIAHARALSHSNDRALVDLMVRAASHSSPLVRFWGVMGLAGKLLESEKSGRFCETAESSKDWQICSWSLKDLSPRASRSFKHRTFCTALS